MRLLIVVPRQDPATGNRITATRLQQGMSVRGHIVSVHETDGAAAPLAAAAGAFRPELVLLLHAWRSGRPWLDTGLALPFAVLLTGTDVNAGLGDPVQGPVIAMVLQRATAILAQNPQTVEALRWERPQLAAGLHYLPPGITLGTAPFPLRERLSLPPGRLLLLCPAGIRAIKGLLELVGMCAPLAAEDRLHLAFCGPCLDADYGRRLEEAVAAASWATLLGIIPPAAMPAAMRQADVIVNNSVSEGLPNALVEAAVLGRPIVARDIPGNAAVVTEGSNGLLYRDGDGFRVAIRRLQDEPGLAAALSRPDPGRFAAEREAAALEALCLDILAKAGAP